VSDSFSIQLWEAVSEADRMNRAEGKKSAVTLIHPFTADLLYADLGIERPEASEDFDPAPKFHLTRLVEDETIPVYEVCVLSDDDYMEHLRDKLKDGRS
jgi:hypothetical protein